MKRLARLPCRAALVAALGCMCSCSASPGSAGAASHDAGKDAAQPPGTDGGLLDAAGAGSPDVAQTPDGAPTPDAAPSMDAPAMEAAALPDSGPLMVSCGFDRPILVVTQPSGGAGTTLLRLPLRFTGSASDITLTSVTELAADPAMTVLRTWNVADLVPPSGFAGSVTATQNDPYPTPLFTATDAAIMTETTACGQAPWDRPGGTIHVTGTTHEGGAFTADCATGLTYNGNAPEQLPFACATGTPGWLGGEGSDSPAVMPVTTPVVAVLVSSAIHVFDLGPAPLSGFAVTGATITAHMNPFPPPGMMCPTMAPGPWMLTGGLSQLWEPPNSSTTAWSGPAPALVQTDADWFYQNEGETPPGGYCSPPSMNPMSCPLAVEQVIFSGTSSAGSFQWESDLFSCIEM